MADNNWDCVNRGRAYRKPQFGEANPHNKLTRAQVAEIRRVYALSGLPQHAVGKMFGVGQMQVSRIVRFENWA